MGASINDRTTSNADNNMWRVLASAAALFLLGTDSLTNHGPFGSRNVFTRDMRDFSVADQGRFWGGTLGWGVPFRTPRDNRPAWSGMVLGLGKRSGGIGNMYRGAPSLEDAGMLIGMGKRNSLDEEADILMAMHKRYPFMDPFGPLINQRWNKHQRIQRRAQESAEDNKEVEDVDEDVLNPINDPELGERMMDKRSGFTLPTPNVEDAGMLMGMGKRTRGPGEFGLDSGLGSPVLR